MKHIPRITLIHPPAESDKDEMWKVFAELAASDIELLSQITIGNKSVAYLNSQQVRYFKDLMEALNSSICRYNMDKIFKIFEVNEIIYYLIECTRPNYT